MAGWRIATIGAGVAKAGPALLPVPSPLAQAFQSRGPVCGSPGTRRIPAPAPLPVIDSSFVAMAQSGQIGLPSSVFSYWTPGIYYARPASRAPVSVLSDNQMPVPATDPRGKPGVVMPGPVLTGQRQVANPRVAPKYLNRKRSR
jgi:hypothetical protein